MLAGCSSTLLSPRNRLRSETSLPLPFQPCYFPALQEKMGTQRLDLPCAFTRKDGGPRVSISLEKPIDARTSTFSFRQNHPITPTSLSSSLAVPWEAVVVEEERKAKPKRSTVKRFYDTTTTTSFLDDGDERDDDSGGGYSRQSKRIKKGFSDSNDQRLVGLGAADSSVWFPQFLQGPPPPIAAEEESIITFGKLVPDDRENKKKSLAATAAAGGGGGGAASGGSSIQKIQSGPSCSSNNNNPGSRCSSPNGREEGEEEESPGNGSHHPFQYSGERAAVRGEEEGSSSITEQHRGLELMSLLMACLESICSRNYAGTNYFLARLGELASPEVGTSTIHRIVAYFTEALVLRVAKLWPNLFSVTPPLDISGSGGGGGGGGNSRVDYEDENNNNNMALWLLNHVSPIPKFIHFSMNQILLRAFEGKDRVHIIDFDIKQGLQWPSLFQSLASRRPSPPSHVRITGIGNSRRELQDTGARLAGFAESLNLPFQFHAVVDRFEDVRFWMLHVKEGECVAVNLVGQLHKALYDDDGDGGGGSGSVVLMELLALIRSTNPAIVVVAEQEAEHNDPRWEARLVSSLPYYAAVFDSIDACLPPSSLARVKVEQMFAREIRNIVACEGHDRVERHRPFARWRRLLEERGMLRPVGFAGEAGEMMLLQSRILLRMYYYPSSSSSSSSSSSGECYSVVMQGDDHVGLTLKWFDQPLYTVSAWESSSSSSPDVLVTAAAGTTTTSISHRDS